MGRVLIICGSAGRGGATEAMCQVAADRVRGDGDEAIVVFPSEMDIRHCTGCGLCADGRCVIEDDMSEIYGLFAESDMLVLVTPLHFNGPSSLIKTVMDRFQVYWNHGGLPHPAAAAGLVCAGSDRPNFSPVLSIMRAFSATTGMAWVGEVCIPGTDRNGCEGIRDTVSEAVGGLIGAGMGRSSSPRGARIPEGGR